MSLLHFVQSINADYFFFLTQYPGEYPKTVKYPCDIIHFKNTVKWRQRNFQLEQELSAIVLEPPLR
jgi:hypothetical protein